jgi:hypothetical protein
MILFDRAVAIVNLVFYLSSSIIRNVLIDFEDLDLFVPVGVFFMKNFKKNSVPNIQQSLILSQAITNKYSCKLSLREIIRFCCS